MRSQSATSISRSFEILEIGEIARAGRSSLHRLQVFNRANGDGDPKDFCLGCSLLQLVVAGYAIETLDDVEAAEVSFYRDLFAAGHCGGD